MSDFYNRSRPSTPEYRANFDFAFGGRKGDWKVQRPDRYVPPEIRERMKAQESSESHFFHVCHVEDCPACNVKGCPSNDV